MFPYVGVSLEKKNYFSVIYIEKNVEISLVYARDINKWPWTALTELSSQV